MGELGTPELQGIPSNRKGSYFGPFLQESKNMVSKKGRFYLGEG